MTSRSSAASAGFAAARSASSDTNRSNISPAAALENYRRGLMRINSRERYDRFLRAGFPVLLRDENRTVEETLALVEKAFGLA